MSPEEAQKFLSSQVANIVGFMDYEVTISSKEEFYKTLYYSLGSHRWQESGCEFVHLGHSGSGSDFAVWIRPNDELRPVVFFGSEGGNGVLASSVERFVKALYYGPDAWEDHKKPSRLMLLDDRNEDEKHALEQYRAALGEVFSEIEPFETLVSGVAELNSEFAIWCTQYNDHGKNEPVTPPVVVEPKTPVRKRSFLSRLFGSSD